MKTPVTLLAAAGLLAVPAAAIAKDRASPVAPTSSPGNWFPPNSYPPEAKRRGEQGRVSIRLKVAPSGEPTACVVTASSGSSSLDAATCDLALTNGRFTPAKDSGGRPIEATYTVPGIRWELYDDQVGNQLVDLSGGPKSITTTNVEIAVDEQGKGISCRPLPSTMGNAGCAAFTPGTQITPSLWRNGKPVAGKVTLNSTTWIEPR